MNKSDMLDELRLEVGMIADRVSTCQDFYLGIINTLGKHLPQQFGVALYRCHNGFFCHLSGYGTISEKNTIKYGDGMFSICSIRGKVTIHREFDKIRAYAPIYDGQNLIGIFLVECQDIRYEVTDEDIIFLKEISRYIEVKGKKLSNASIDNFEY